MLLWHSRSMQLQVHEDKKGKIIALVPSNAIQMHDTMGCNSF